MRLTTKRTCEITITLDEDEAKILKAMLQNPVGHGVPDVYESIEAGRVRTELYNELNEALGGWNPAG